jgi:alpha-amylase
MKQSRARFWLLVVTLALARAAWAQPIPDPWADVPIGEHFNGRPDAVMLQGFHWYSHEPVRASNGSVKSWYRVVKENAAAIRSAGFDYVWLPPPSTSAAPEGYMPSQWYELDTPYGTTAELKDAIATLGPAKALADVVVNHRVGKATAGADFVNPAFADNNAAVTGNDECGCGRGDAETGSDSSIPYARDLDHTNASVRQEIVSWLRFLKSEIGFAGWRYDLVKGFAGRFVRVYNEATQPELSVGEYWDDGSRQAVVDWIDATRGRSMAFDFPTRSLLRQAIQRREFWRLKTIDGKPSGVIGWWPSMSVTFLDNHDTQYGHFNQHFSGAEVLQGYAYVLTHPGIPCVFWTHFFDWGDENRTKIARLITVRKRRGLNSRSVVDIRAADEGRYAAIVDGKVAVKIGPGPWDPGPGWDVAVDGQDFAVWEKH